MTTAVFEAAYSSPCDMNSIKRRMIIKHWWNVTGRESLYCEKNLSQCYFVDRHRFDWPEFESGRPSVTEWWHSCKWCITFRFLPHKEQNTSPPQRPISFTHFKLCMYRRICYHRDDSRLIGWTELAHRNNNNNNNNNTC
jgi:hypothetical protein